MTYFLLSSFLCSCCLGYQYWWPQASTKGFGCWPPQCSTVKSTVFCEFNVAIDRLSEAWLALLANILQPYSILISVLQAENMCKADLITDICIQSDKIACHQLLISFVQTNTCLIYCRTLTCSLLHSSHTASSRGISHASASYNHPEEVTCAISLQGFLPYLVGIFIIQSISTMEGLFLHLREQHVSFCCLSWPSSQNNPRCCLLNSIILWHACTLRCRETMNINLYSPNIGYAQPNFSSKPSHMGYLNSMGSWKGFLISSPLLSSISPFDGFKGLQMPCGLFIWAVARSSRFSLFLWAVARSSRCWLFNSQVRASILRLKSSSLTWCA